VGEGVHKYSQRVVPLVIIRYSKDFYILQNYTYNRRLKCLVKIGVKKSPRRLPRLVVIVVVLPTTQCRVISIDTLVVNYKLYVYQYPRSVIPPVVIIYSKDLYISQNFIQYRGLKYPVKIGVKQ